MVMRARMQQVLAALVVATLIGGCGLPVSVRKVTDSDSTRGIRYTLKRPTYVVGLRLDPNSIIDAKPGQPLDAVTLCKAGPDRVCPDAPGAPAYCVRNRSQVAVVIRQTMDGPPLQYEVGAPDFLTAIGNSFAETDFSITLADDGALSAISAGATDRSLEFIQAVAGLAVDAAKSGAGAALAQACFVIPGDDFPNYVRRQRELLAARAEFTRTLDAAVKALPAQKPAEVADALEGIAALQTQRAAAEAQLAELLLPLPKDNYTLQVDGTVLNDGANPLLAVSLTNDRPVEAK
jgi:hypothetical protein